jgi:hypothetical protein
MARWRTTFRRLPAERVHPSAVGRSWGLASAVLTKAALGVADGVLVKCYPGASAPAAGLINMLSRNILVDGELFGCDPADIPDPPDREHMKQLMVVLGVTFHECGHGNHTPSPDEYEAVPAELLDDARTLEEARMEARANESHPRCTTYLRAAVGRVLLEHAPEAPEAPLTRAVAVRQAALVLGRVPAGTLLQNEVTAIEGELERVLGGGDLARVKEIVAEVCRASDEKAIPALIDGARKLAEIEPPPPEFGGSAGGGSSSGSGSGMPDPGGLTWSDVEDILEAAARDWRDSEVDGDGETDDLVEDLRKVARSIAKGGAPPTKSVGLYGGGIGLSGPEIPPSGGRPPVAVERIAVSRLATALRRARSKRLIQEGRVAPPGRFSGRGAMRQASELERGAPIRGLAFRTRRTVVQELWHPLVGIVADVSGSMAGHLGALASVLWVVHTAVEEVDGRAGASLFSAEAKLLCSPGRRLAQVPVVTTAGGTTAAGDAIEVLTDAMPFDDRRRPRLMVMIGDGLWHAEDGEREIAELQASGCGVVSVGIDSEPVAHGEDRVVAVSHPLEIAAVIGRACVDVITAR